MKTLLIPLGLILSFRRQIGDFLIKSSLLFYFSGQELDSMVYIMTAAMGNSYWHRYYLWNSQRNPF